MTELNDVSDALVRKKLAQFYVAISDPQSCECETLRMAKRIIEENPEVLRKLLSNTTTDFVSDTTHADFVDDHFTILNIARIFWDIDVLHYLVTQAADLKIRYNENDTIVHLTMKWELLDFKYNNPYEQFFRKIENIFVDVLFSKQVRCGTIENLYNSSGLSYLHIACVLNKTEIIKLFLDHGESINEPIGANSTLLPGYTPLHLAVRYCAFEAIKLLLDEGADIYAADIEGISPLHLLLQWSMQIEDDVKGKMTAYKLFMRDFFINQCAVQMMYKQDVSLPDGFSYLHIACSMKNSEKVSQLLEKDICLDCSIKLDAKLWPGYTALHFAAHFNIDTLKLLMDYGGDILIEDSNGFTPLDLCLQRYGAQQLHLIILNHSRYKEIQFSDKQTKLVDLIFAMQDQSSFSEFLESMPNVGASIPLDAPIWPGCTPLHLAVLFAERKRDIKGLCKKTDYKSKKNNITEEKDLYIERISVCLSLNADITEPDAFGYTPVHLAYRLEKLNAVKVLLEHHLKVVNPIDAGGLSHLHVACAVEKIELVEKLLFGAADVNSHIFPIPTSSAKLVNDKRRPISNRLLPVPLGTTWLHIAMEMENGELTELLLKRGADLYAKNVVGSTPIQKVLPMHRVTESVSSTRYPSPCFYQSMKKITVCGFTPLLLSACKDNVEAVERFLKFGENIESAVGQVSNDNCESSTIADSAETLPKGLKGYRALHFAVRNLSLRMIELLLKHGADFFAKSDDASVPLYMAFEVFGRNSKNPFAKLLKSNHALQTRVKEETGITMLHVACNFCDVDLAKKALEDGIDVNARTFKDSPVWPNSTPLHILQIEKRSDKSSIDLLRILLEHGADVTTANNTKTAIWAYWRNNCDLDPDNNEVMDLLMSAVHDYSENPGFGEATPFHIACSRNAVTQVEGFLKAGVDVNLAVDYYSEFEKGWTPLHYAIKGNTMEAFDLLIKHGADIRMEDTHGDTPLHFAIQSEALTLDLLDRIIRVGADVNAQNIYGETPFECLLRNNRRSKEMIDLFIREASHVNVYNTVTDEGLIAIAFNSLEELSPTKIVEMFNNSTDFLKVDVMNRNVLHNVVSKNQDFEPVTQYISIIDEIVSLGCDIDATDSFGRTPLCTAIRFENYEGAAGLIECGADISVTDRCGNTAFSYSLGIDKKYKSYHKINSMFIRHLQMKQYAGLHCNRKDVTNLGEAIKELNLALIPSDYQDIMEKLKLASIGSSSVTLQDFLSETGAVAAYPHMKQLERQIVDDFFQHNKSQLRKEYPKWSGLLLLQYRKAQARVALMEPATVALYYLTASCLDELCYVEIVRYLSNEELKVLIECVSNEEE